MTMSDEEVQNLEDPRAWDQENAVTVRPKRKVRAVVSVAIPAEAFDQISESAERAGMKLSEFIRDAAMEKTASLSRMESIELSGTSLGALVVSDSQGSCSEAPLVLSSEQNIQGDFGFELKAATTS